MASSGSTGQLLAKKILGIDVNERFTYQPSDLDTRATAVVDPADIFFEPEPSVSEVFKELVPTRAGALNYVSSLFPSAEWLPRYNLRWLLGDVVAGITIGLVVVPQAMAYAAIAQLPPAYGLYTSFTGVVAYFVFGTSKDVVIGATAVGSLLVGEVIHHVNSTYPGQYTNPEIAHCLSMLAGAVLLLFGLLRLGWIIEFIPYIPISAFVTAASITIMSTQIPTVLGIPGINTREAPYRVIVNTLKGLPNVQLDAAIGLTCIFMLFAIQTFCTRMEGRQPQRKAVWSFVSSLRMTFAMLLYILVSFLVNRGKENHKFRIVGVIEPGFQAAGVPTPDVQLITTVLPQLPAVVIILIIEHIAIAKAMGRMLNYTIVPSQEIVAGGIANLFSPFLGGYVCTGSFGASAVLSKAGARTPLAGVFSALILVLALYALTGVFFYIPNAALAGLIIHAVFNLIAPPRNLFKYWQLSPIELLIWITCVILAMFQSLEISIYVGIGLSMAVMLVRLARTPGRFVGEVRTRRVTCQAEKTEDGHSETVDLAEAERTVFVSMERDDAHNPNVRVEAAYPGVFIYRFSENFNFANQAYHVESLKSHILDNTRRTSEEEYDRPSDRLWNDPGPKTAKGGSGTELPTLRALVLDFSAVNSLDITAIQGLVDLKNSLDRYTAPDVCEWHFANVQNRWTRRALAVAGFGYPTAKNPRELQNWIPSYSVAPVLPAGHAVTTHSRPMMMDEEACTHSQTTLGGIDATTGDRCGDEERRPSKAQTTSPSSTVMSGPMATVFGVDRPFFHMDLLDAVDAAVRDARNKDHRALV
ncbi:hypothetical protein S40285_01483 [Stachybotrys chlorohalonatus IBT 40285]|uniref:STAS domain-containing protein n=1 Tax=Stachybotrys chlorohalonatus (strain IBT 40285) TaxID=1283841 RepID=A0A084QMJ7_STAC4|nr:hypothetical protein S40285_01483 [Stachybotrys chlorohalonata IBT 40285]